MSIISSLANNFSSTGKLKSSGFNNASLANVTALDSSIALGNLILLSTQTASASSSISFTSGIDSTYDEYIFKFINCHPASAGTFTFNLSTDNGSNYNVTKTSTFFYARQNESRTPVGLSYETGYDLAQSTSYQILTDSVPVNNDDSASGYLHLFAPSSNTYVKHFLATMNSTYSIECFVAGYANTTSAINAVDFKFASGNIDDGIIKMYGVKKS